MVPPSIFSPLNHRPARGSEAPPRFDDALAMIGATVARCEKEGIPRDSLLAAMLAELMPRMVAAFGARGVAAVLGHLAAEITAVESWVKARQ